MAYSKPVGFLIVVPVARPFQKLGAGRSKPMMSFPDSFVGGVLCAEAVAVTATTAHAPSAARMMRLTNSLLVLEFRGESSAPDEPSPPSIRPSCTQPRIV